MDLLSACIEHLILINDKNNNYQGQKDWAARSEIHHMTNIELIELIGRVLQIQITKS